VSLFILFLGTSGDELRATEAQKNPTFERCIMMTIGKRYLYTYVQINTAVNGVEGVRSLGSV